MARLARVVVPGAPHHVTQRGNRRLATFSHEADYAAYRALMAEGPGVEQAALLRRHERTGRPLGSACLPSFYQVSRVDPVDLPVDIKCQELTPWTVDPVDRLQ